MLYIVSIKVQKSKAYIEVSTATRDTLLALARMLEDAPNVEHYYVSTSHAVNTRTFVSAFAKWRHD